MTAPTVLCVGHVCWDEVLHLDRDLAEERSAETVSLKTAGGGATNTAMVLAGTDVVSQVYLAGAVGSDTRGDRVVETLEENGVELVVPRMDEPTTKIRAVITDEKKPQYMHEDASLPQFLPADVSDSVWDEIDHMHVTSFDVEMAAAFAKRAVDEGVTVSFNPTQGYFEASFEAVVERADLIQMNRGESEEFTRRHGSIGAIVANGDGTDIVVTHGPAGCTLYSVEGLAHHEGFLVDEVVDTVGAGDSFMAGLLSTWLVSESLDESLRVGNAHGALSVSYMGAPEQIPSEDVEELLDAEER